MAQKLSLCYEGRAKQVYLTDDPSLLILNYKDDATAYNGLKMAIIAGKGVVNNQISALLMSYLSEHGVRTHFVSLIGERECLIKKAEMIPLKVIVRNRASGSICSRLGVREGTDFKTPIVEYYYKNSDLGDPMLNEAHIHCLDLASCDEIREMKSVSLRVNELLTDFLKAYSVDLIDFKLEFGRDEQGIVLADGISPDTCRFWDSKTHESLDKDRFRQDMGDVEEAYKEIYDRLLGGKKA